MTTRTRPEPKGRWVTTTGHVTQAMAIAAAGLGVPAEPAEILCRGLCQHSCGPAPMTPVERARVQEAIGRPLYVDADTLTCSALNDAGRCDAHNVRPLICRLWGQTEGMICGHGCTTTTGEYLTYPESMALIARAHAEEGPLDVPVTLRGGPR